MTIELSECRKHVTSGRWNNSKGKEKIAIQCPYCDGIVYAFIGSFAGAGKKCNCGVLHMSNGYSYKKPNKRKGQ